MTVELREITPDDLDLRAVLAGQTLRPEQHEFATIAAETLPLSDQDHDWLPVAVVAGGVPVGMFVLDLRGYMRALDDNPATVLFRAFYIAPEHQGKGYATAAVSATGAYVRQRLPGVTRVVLGANHRNPVAVAAYLRGGFVMTGQDYLGGLIGPQHVMELEV
jgi:RimJ/RimL family protein N-acetyltransferase